jgi:hypothetical protein
MDKYSLYTTPLMYRIKTHLPVLKWGKAVENVEKHRWLLNAAASLNQVMWIYGGQESSGANFPLVLRFLLPLYPPIVPYSSSSIVRSCTMG